MPDGWQDRTCILFRGKSILLKTLGRSDLIKDKLWGFCDLRSHDREVLINLRPTDKELQEAATWVKKQEGNPRWPAHVDVQVQSILQELKNEYKNK